MSNLGAKAQSPLGAALQSPLGAHGLSLTQGTALFLYVIDETNGTYFSDPILESPTNRWFIHLGFFHRALARIPSDRLDEFRFAIMRVPPQSDAVPPDLLPSGETFPDPVRVFDVDRLPTVPQYLHVLDVMTRDWLPDIPFVYWILDDSGSLDGKSHLDPELSIAIGAFGVNHDIGLLATEDRGETWLSWFQHFLDRVLNDLGIP